MLLPVMLFIVFSEPLPESEELFFLNYFLNFLLNYSQNYLPNYPPFLRFQTLSFQKACHFQSPYFLSAAFLVILFNTVGTINPI